MAPTLLDLLGIEPGIPPQGAPMWDPRLESRTTCFFANHYLGADGFHRAGTMVMRSDIDDAVYMRRGELAFRSEDLVTDEAARREATERIRSMIALQQTWVRRFGVAPAGR